MGRGGRSTTRWRALAASLLLLQAAACGWLNDDDHGATTTDGGSSSTTEWMCTTECDPGICEDLECEGMVCKVVNRPPGWDFDLDYGDCMTQVCDGNGGYNTVQDLEDPPREDRGNCAQSICEADGGSSIVVDPSDTPDDGLECTYDACVDGVPTSTPMATNTRCGPGDDGYCDPAGKCLTCPTLDPCADPGPEPSDSQSTAIQLGQITDKDGDGGTVCGVLGTADDVDWYVYGGNDVAFAMVDPTRTVTASAAARLCVYAKCGSGGTAVSCFLDSPATAPFGEKGCCGFGTVSPSINCDGLDDSATIWIKVENTDELGCLQYQLDYHF
ncbi:MAG: hypothetical protein R3B09_21835 [Nannocystaceae bacterium]